MALTNCYITLNEMREHSTIPDVNDDATLEPAITSACRAIDAHCGRIFYDTGSATARTYAAIGDYLLWVDDFSTTTGLVVKTDDDDDGVFETTWSASNYELNPTWDPQLGSVPYNTLRAIGTSAYFPRCGYRRYRVEVTARWGWAAVPDVIAQATKIVALDLWKRKDAPFGVTGTVDFGGIRIGRDLLAGVATLLQPYRRAEFTHGIA